MIKSISALVESPLSACSGQLRENSRKYRELGRKTYLKLGYALSVQSWRENTRGREIRLFIRGIKFSVHTPGKCNGKQTSKLSRFGTQLDTDIHAIAALLGYPSYRPYIGYNTMHGPGVSIYRFLLISFFICCSVPERDQRCFLRMGWYCKQGRDVCNMYVELSHLFVLFSIFFLFPFSFSFFFKDLYSFI